MTTRSNSGGISDGPVQWASSAVGTDGKYETSQGVSRLAWNRYEATFWRVSRSPGRRSNTGVEFWYASNCFPSSNLKPNDQLKVQSELAAQAKGHEFNLAVSAAEGKQTVNMAVSAVKTIGGVISDLKRGKFENAARRLGVKEKPSKLRHTDVAGRFLELQYGWLPLMSDTYEAMKAYHALTSNSRRSLISAQVSRSAQRDSSCSATTYSCKGTLKSTIKVIYEASEVISAPRSLGLVDPASVVWEKIPYSFVVDWFIPIGDYLENLNTIPQLRGRFLTISTERFSGAALRLKGDGVLTWTTFPQAHASYFYMLRVPSTTLVVTKPQFVSVPDAMSPKRIWNAIALVAQRIK